MLASPSGGQREGFDRRMTPFLRILVVLGSLAGGAGALPLSAQDQEEWEGKVVDEIRAERAQGWKRHRFSAYRDKLQLRAKDKPYDKALRDSDVKTLFKTGHFDKVSINVAKSPE